MSKINKKTIKGQSRRSGKRSKALEIISVDIGISTAEAMRQAGYARSTAEDHPEYVTKSLSFKQILDNAGVTDEFLAKRHKELSHASTLKEFFFEHKRVKELIEIDEDDPDWDKKGRPKQFKLSSELKPVGKKHIKAIIETMKGAELVYVREDYTKSVAYVIVPDNQARRSALDLGLKVKGHFAAEKVNLTIEDEEITPEERQKLNELRNLK